MPNPPLRQAAGRNIRYDRLMRSYQMTFCGCAVYHDREDFVRRFSFKDEYGVELSDAVGIILVDLTKLGDVMKKPVDKMNGEEFWALFLAIGSDPAHKDLLNKMIAARREIGMAVELLQTISKDENERARFRARCKYQMDMQHDLIVARNEGESAKAIAIAKNALQMGMAIDTIITLTELTREEIEGLRVSF